MRNTSPRHFRSLNFQKSKMADGRHFENLKLQYLYSHLRYRGQILHGDPQHQSAPYWKLKIWTFTNPRWRKAAILKIYNRYVLATVEAIATKFCTLTRGTTLRPVRSRKLEFLKNSRWRTAAVLKNLKLLYLRSHSSYRNEIYTMTLGATVHTTDSWKFDFKKSYF